MADLDELENRVSEIEKRNKRVETDKAWETSWFRKVLLLLFTYLTIGTYLWIIGIANPLVNAVVPAVGFLLSTLTLPFFKRLWERLTCRDS
jgi:hypothetical protein